MEARFTTFSANRLTEYRSHARAELIGCFVHLGHPILFCIFHCQNKSV